MRVVVSETPEQLGVIAGKTAAFLISQAIEAKGYANVVLATGKSQFETLSQIIQETQIDWSTVTMFHLDEYVGLPLTHDASFRKYLYERFITKVPPLKNGFFIDGEANLKEEIERLNGLITQYPIDVALVGIGENGHLAFNDPPADFETEKPFLVVRLDERCRYQQLNEGWFDSLEQVPEFAISMSVSHIMKSNHIVCSVPDQRKAEAVRDSLEKAVSNIFPASILQQHANCVIFLDRHSASLLSRKEYP